MIRLYGICPVWGLPDVSTFVTKVDCYLRMAELPFTLVSLLGENITKTYAGWSSGDLPRLPKGKFPYIEDGGTVIGDSGFIIDYLKATYGDRLGESTLKSEERAIAWIEDAAWEQYKRLMYGPLASAEMMEASRENVRQELAGQGTGRHTRSEVYELGNADLSALSVYLGDKPYALGERPTELDATLYAFLARILWCPDESPLKTHARTLANFEPYCQRMHKQYYFTGNQQ